MTLPSFFSPNILPQSATRDRKESSSRVEREELEDGEDGVHRGGRAAAEGRSRDKKGYRDETGKG